MRAGPPDEVLAGACRWRPRVTSWLGGQLLAATLPVLSGHVIGKTTDEVIESLDLTVPRFGAAEEGSDVVDWRPSSTTSPLARFGQALDITVIVESVVTAQTWETRVGRFQIKDWDDDDAGNITIKGESMLARTRDDKMLAATSPTGTFISEARRLLPAGMGASFDSALVDRACPAGMSWSKDRLQNLQEIANAWPALLRIDEWGQVQFKAPLPAVPTPMLTLRDGVGGTLISAPRADSRTDAYNTIIATTSASNAADVQGVAAILAGPMSVNGPYGAVVKEWSSPLIENEAQARAAAATMLSNSTRPAQSVPVRIAPDPRIELDDALQVVRGDEDRLWGWVTGYDLPLTTGDGDMRVDIGVAA